jgi:flagellar basal body P-ring formation protein FlgA
MKSILFSFGFGVAIGFTTLSAKAESAAPIIKSVATVSASTLSLADLMVGADLPTAPLFAAPAPGQTGSISAARIAEAARKAGIPKILGDLTGTVLVTRKGRPIPQQDINAAIERAIISQGGFQNPELSFATAEAQPKLFVGEDETATPMVADLAIDRATQHFRATLTMPTTAMVANTPITVEGQIIDWVDVPVVTRALDKNDIVSPRDIRIEKRERQSLVGIKPVDPATAAGQAARAPIVTGSILTEDAISRPVLVEKSMAVTVNYGVGGLSLSLRGKANEAGMAGDVISVLNPQTKKIIFATVTGPGIVTVTPLPANRLASN